MPRNLRLALLLDALRALPDPAWLAGDLDEVQLFARAPDPSEVLAIFEEPRCKWSAGCASASPVAEGCLWPPKHRYVCYADLASLLPAFAGDGDALRVVDCVSSQPEDEAGDGSTVDDCDVSDDGLGFCLRSERDGRSRAGRTYTVTVGIEQDCGLATTGTILLHVPHDQRDGGDCQPASPHDFLLPHEEPF